VCVCVCVCGLETLEFWRPKPNVDCSAAEQEKHSLKKFQYSRTIFKGHGELLFFNLLTRNGSPFAIPRRLAWLSNAIY